MGDQEIVSQSSPSDGFEVKISDWVKEGWELVKANLGLTVLVTLVYIVILSAASATYIGQLLLMGPLQAGMFAFFFAIMRGQGAKFENLFDPFKMYVPTMLVGLVTSMFVFLAVIVCLIPIFIVSLLVPFLGLIFSVLLILPALFVYTIYLFALPIVIEQKLPFWDAMELSRKTIMKKWPEMLLFYFVTGLITFVGFLFCFVGALITAPIGMAALAVAYRDIFGLKSVT